MKLSAVVCFVLGLATNHVAASTDEHTFQFTYQGLTYSGAVMRPQQAARGVIVIIPGHGSTELVGGDQFLELRRFLVEQRYNVAYWDKAGNGLSEGEYDHNQSIASSAEEGVAAIEAIGKLGLANGDNLGFWSISRGGWIVPKITELFDGMRFWISVSGTTELDNSRYMLEANLRAEKRSPEQVALLMSEWDDYQRILVRGGTLDEFNASTENLLADPYFNSNNFQMTEEVLRNIQSYFQSGALEFDEATNLAVMYPGLESTLSKLTVPVLAVLGRLDTQIDWQAVGELYSRASKSGGMKLTRVFLDDCNHVMQKSVTGGVNEELAAGTPACDGYYDALGAWLDSLDSGKGSSP
ncbi:MAG: alpha/beta hydrolase [Pseudomonadota bacterium]